MEWKGEGKGKMRKEVKVDEEGNEGEMRER